MGSSAHITASQTLKLIWWYCILVDFLTGLSNIFTWCLIETFYSLKWVIQNKNLSTWKIFRNTPNYLIHTSVLFWYMLFENYKTTQSNPYFHVCTLNGNSQYPEKHFLGIGLEMIGEAFSHVLRMRVSGHQMVLPWEILLGRAEFLFLFIASQFQQVSCENPSC